MSRVPTHCLINAQAVTDPLIDIADRGLRYGDGVFETIAIVDGKPALWDAHIHRLSLGCQRLGIPLPVREALEKERDQLTFPAFGVLRITVTRGSGGIGYAPPVDPQPCRILQIMPAANRPADYWRAGVNVIRLQTPLAKQPVLAGIKHLNRLEQVLGRQEWSDPNIAEGLMSTTDGDLVEATSANLLLEADGRVWIPDTHSSGVDGIMQAWLVEAIKARGGMVERGKILSSALESNYALMLCNSVFGLWPVVSVDAKPMPWPAWFAPLAKTIDKHRVALTPTVTGIAC